MFAGSQPARSLSLLTCSSSGAPCSARASGFKDRENSPGSPQEGSLGKAACGENLKEPGWFGLETVNLRGTCRQLLLCRSGRAHAELPQAGMVCAVPGAAPGPALARPVWGAGLGTPRCGAGGADLAVTSSLVLLLTATITFHLHHRPWDPLTVFACLTVQSSPVPGSSAEVLG